ncbi:hypothetical protein M0813_05269 [Anaeramoeba flamelloides]|uniref:Ras guanine nucleotide exchange factor n=1 Tax=Anaeramoeba flamelloides TaxID=1746091 RepID=A0ABQ8XJ49_9EUKA|nr:hypothetical protein M0813_05269 [Anaeramoeba flamelloides]
MFHIDHNKVRLSTTRRRRNNRRTNFQNWETKSQKEQKTKRRIPKSNSTHEKSLEQLFSVKDETQTNSLRVINGLTEQFETGTGLVVIRSGSLSELLKRIFDEGLNNIETIQDFFLIYKNFITFDDLFGKLMLSLSQTTKTKTETDQEYLPFKLRPQQIKKLLFLQYWIKYQPEDFTNNLSYVNNTILPFLKKQIKEKNYLLYYSIKKNLNQLKEGVETKKKEKENQSSNKKEIQKEKEKEKEKKKKEKKKEKEKGKGKGKVKEKEKEKTTIKTKNNSQIKNETNQNSNPNNDNNFDFVFNQENENQNKKNSYSSNFKKEFLFEFNQSINPKKKKMFSVDNNNNNNNNNSNNNNNENIKNTIQDHYVPKTYYPSNLNKIQFQTLSEIEVSRQLSLYDLELFQKITLSEFIGLNWSNERKMKNKSENLFIFLKRFDLMRRLIISKILFSKKMKKRAEMIEKWVSIAKLLLQLRNFNSLFIIISALQSEPIVRLDLTWGCINSSVIRDLDKLITLTSSENNYRKYRQMLNNITLPAIPFIQLMLYDISFIEYNENNFITNNSSNGDNKTNNNFKTINFNKFFKIAKVIKIIKVLQKSKYNFRKINKIINFFIDINPPIEKDLITKSKSAVEKKSILKSSKILLPSLVIISHAEGDQNKERKERIEKKEKEKFDENIIKYNIDYTCNSPKLLDTINKSKFLLIDEIEEMNNFINQYQKLNLDHCILENDLTNDDKKVLIAATIDWLVEYFIYEKGDFQEDFHCFMLTYRSYITPLDLFSKFQNYYLKPSRILYKNNNNNQNKKVDINMNKDRNLNNSHNHNRNHNRNDNDNDNDNNKHNYTKFKIYEEKILKKIKFQINKIFYLWIKIYFSDFYSDPDLIIAIQSFINNNMLTDKEMVKPANMLRSVLLKMQNNYLINTKIVNEIKISGNDNLNLLKNNRTFLEIDRNEFVKELTLIEFNLFKKIQPQEFLQQSWTKDNKNNSSPNLVILTDYFNTISSWVTFEILKYDKLKVRIQVLKKMLLILLECKKVNNFMAVQEIIAGLNNAAIYRLKRTWGSIPKKLLDDWQEVNSLMSNDNSYRLIRLELKKIVPPALPYIGMYLTDLVFVDNGNPDYISTTDGRIKLINFDKMRKTALIIREIKQFQQTPYFFNSNDYVQKYILKCSSFVYDVEELYNLSLKVEPREVK